MSFSNALPRNFLQRSYKRYVDTCNIISAHLLDKTNQSRYITMLITSHEAFHWDFLPPISSCSFISSFSLVQYISIPTQRLGLITILNQKRPTKGEYEKFLSFSNENGVFISSFCSCTGAHNFQQGDYAFIQNHPLTR